MSYYSIFYEFYIKWTVYKFDIIPYENIDVIGKVYYMLWTLLVWNETFCFIRRNTDPTMLLREFHTIFLFFYTYCRSFFRSNIYPNISAIHTCLSLRFPHSLFKKLQWIDSLIYIVYSSFIAVEVCFIAVGLCFIAVDACFIAVNACFIAVARNF